MELTVTSAIGASRLQQLLRRMPAALLMVALAVTLSGAAQGPDNDPAPDFGPNVIVFDPSMPVAQIQTVVDGIANQQVSNQFGTQRYALLFKPGVYGSATTPLDFQVGFYTDVAGLGASPTDVTINGHIDVYNQCFAANNCSALDNFWRSLSNLTINVTGLSGCRGSGEFWAVSQASPLRRVNITGGNLTLMDYCTAGPQYASGGFIANSQTGFVINGSQQQFYVRNSQIGVGNTGTVFWSNGVWNQVFSGVIGAPAQSYPNQTYTTLPNTPVSREKPYLYLDAAGHYNVFSPALQKASVGNTWAAGTPEAGRSLPIESFFIADPTTHVEEINEALDRGKNLILTPGVYQLKHSIDVRRPDTVVLGLGLATLVPQHGNAALTVGNVDGVQVAGLIMDAGPVNSKVLFEVGHNSDDEGNWGYAAHRGGGEGDDRRDNDGRHAGPSNPISISDVYFRIGGATVGSATTSLQIDRDNVILDNIWGWRADHGATANSTGWTVNTGDHGLVVNGDNVTATGLFVEHYQKDQVQWNGNGGQTIFYQSELPYDPPSQALWSKGSANGYPSYVVNPNVTSHTASGMGIYSFFNQGINIIEDSAITAPSSPNVSFHDAGTVFLNGSGQITHVINSVGTTASSANGGQLQPVVSYP